jgi:hypothetical protein
MIGQWEKKLMEFSRSRENFAYYACAAEYRRVFRTRN